MFRKRSLSDKLFLHFSSKVQNLTVFSKYFHDTNSIFSGRENQFRDIFRAHSTLTHTLTFSNRAIMHLRGQLHTTRQRKCVHTNARERQSSIHRQTRKRHDRRLLTCKCFLIFFGVGVVVVWHSQTHHGASNDWRSDGSSYLHVFTHGRFGFCSHLFFFTHKSVLQLRVARPTHRKRCRHVCLANKTIRSTPTFCFFSNVHITSCAIYWRSPRVSS